MKRLLTACILSISVATNVSAAAKTFSFTGDFEFAGTPSWGTWINEPNPKSLFESTGLVGTDGFDVLTVAFQFDDTQTVADSILHRSHSDAPNSFNFTEYKVDSVTYTLGDVSWTGDSSDTTLYLVDYQNFIPDNPYDVADRFVLSTGGLNPNPITFGFYSKSADIISTTDASAVNPLISEGESFAILPGGVGSYGFDFKNFTPNITSAIPEPATWLMMITGFGLAGAASRRRKKLVV